VRLRRLPSCALLFAACATVPRTITSEPPRHATPSLLAQTYSAAIEPTMSRCHLANEGVRDFCLSCPLTVCPAREADPAFRDRVVAHVGPELRWLSDCRASSDLRDYSVDGRPAYLLRLVRYREEPSVVTADFECRDGNRFRMVLRRDDATLSPPSVSALPADHLDMEFSDD
jgi:hypothetical protein